MANTHITFAASRYHKHTGPNRTVSPATLENLFQAFKEFKGEQPKSKDDQPIFWAYDTSNPKPPYTSLLVVDYDGTTKTNYVRINRLLKTSTIKFITHTTTSHDPSRPTGYHFRLIFGYSSPVETQQHLDVAIRTLHHLGIWTDDIDLTCFQVKRGFYIPRDWDSFNVEFSGGKALTPITKGDLPDDLQELISKYKKNKPRHRDIWVSLSTGQKENLSTILTGIDSFTCNLADIIAAKLPDIIISERGGEHDGYHIHCPFEHEHTTGGDRDTGCFVDNPCPPFPNPVVRCLHKHCEHRTTEDFVKAWIDQGRLTPEDLIYPIQKIESSKKDREDLDTLDQQSSNSKSGDPEGKEQNILTTPTELEEAVKNHENKSLGTNLLKPSKSLQIPKRILNTIFDPTKHPGDFSLSARAWRANHVFPGILEFYDQNQKIINRLEKRYRRENPQDIGIGHDDEYLEDLDDDDLDTLFDFLDGDDFDLGKLPDRILWEVLTHTPVYDDVRLIWLCILIKNVEQDFVRLWEQQPDTKGAKLYLESLCRDYRIRYKEMCDLFNIHTVYLIRTFGEIHYTNAQHLVSIMLFLHRVLMSYRFTTTFSLASIQEPPYVDTSELEHLDREAIAKHISPTKDLKRDLSKIKYSVHETFPLLGQLHVKGHDQFSLLDLIEAMPKIKPHIGTFVRHPEEKGTKTRPEYVDMNPSHETLTRYNTFGFVKGKTLPDKYLHEIMDEDIPVIKDVLVGGGQKVDKALTYVLLYIANIYQYPIKRPPKTLFFVGPQGTGKSTLLNKVFLEPLGVYGLAVTGLAEFADNFNSQLSGRLLINVEEASERFTMSVFEKFKTFVSEPTLLVNEKGTPKYTTLNFARIIASANELNIKLNPEDRRILVFKSGETYKGDKDFWKVFREVISKRNRRNHYKRFFSTITPDMFNTTWDILFDDEYKGNYADLYTNSESAALTLLKVAATTRGTLLGAQWDTVLTITYGEFNELAMKFAKDHSKSFRTVPDGNYVLDLIKALRLFFDDIELAELIELNPMETKLVLKDRKHWVQAFLDKKMVTMDSLGVFMEIASEHK